jgi:hypothetical protein
MTTPTPDLSALTLAHGGHDTPAEGLCLLEAVAWFRGIPHTDYPPCVSPILGAFGRSLNDRLADGPRQALVPFIPRMPGTAGDGLDVARLDVMTRWMLDSWAARWLDVAGLPDHAAKLRGLTVPSWPAAAAAGGATDAADAAAAGAADAAAAAAAAAAADADAAAAAGAAAAAAAATAADAAADAAGAADATAAATADAAGAAADAADAAAAAAATAGAYDLAYQLREVVYQCRYVGYRCARVVAFRAVAGITAYGPAHDAATLALAPLVAEFQAAGVELLDAMISPAASGA